VVKASTTGSNPKENTVTPTFKPSDIQLFAPGSPTPLLGLFGDVGVDIAAAIIVLVCKELNNNEWKEVKPKQAQLIALKESMEGGLFYQIANATPAIEPDIEGLVRQGFAECTLEVGSPLTLTDKAYECLAKAALPVS
jgi:hypothetical protein